MQISVNLLIWNSGIQCVYIKNTPMIHQSFLAIKESCHQGWENMSVSEKGRFCSSCKKHVHDFTNSSIDEIKKAYLESDDGLCGHVPVKLLQQQYVDKNIQIEHFSYLKKFWIAAIFCFGASLFTVDEAKASTFYKIKTSLFNFAAATDSILIKGVVKDKTTAEKLPFVNISVMYNDSVVAKCTTDFEGRYEVKIPKEYSKVDIKAFYISYMTKIVKGIPVAPPYQTIALDFELEQNEIYITEGVIIMEEPLHNDKLNKPKKKKSK